MHRRALRGLIRPALAAALFASCAHHKPAPLPPAVAPAPPPRKGASSVTVLVDPDARLELPPDTRLDPLKFFGHNALPAYPAEALAAGTGDVQVVVRALFGKDHQVGEITDSPLAPKYTGPFATAFRAAVDEAIRGWTYFPPELITLGEVLGYENDGVTPIRAFLAREYVSIRLDLRFVFEIVDGKGRVRLEETKELPVEDD